MDKALSSNISVKLSGNLLQFFPECELNFLQNYGYGHC